MKTGLFSGAPFFQRFRFWAAPGPGSTGDQRNPYPTTRPSHRATIPSDAQPAASPGFELSMLRNGFLRRNRQRQFLGAAHNRQPSFDPDLVAVEQLVQSVDGRDGLAVEFDHHIALAHSGP